jgi:glycosyltransferase involved in cell wall biosynthesis
MGTGVVLDQTPLAAWPEPLREDVNFFNLSCGAGETPASDADYAAVPAKIEEWLSQPEKLEQMMSTNAAYFDRHVHPERVGEAILAAVEAQAAPSTLPR